MTLYQQWCKKYPQYYRAAIERGHLPEIRKKLGGTEKKYWTEQDIYEDAKNYESFQEYRHKGQSYNAATKRKQVNKIISKMNWEKEREYWTEQDIYEDAEEYKTY